MDLKPSQMRVLLVVVEEKFDAKDEWKIELFGGE